MQFIQVPGQANIKQRLIQAFTNGRTGHALTFLGEEGSTAMMLAIAFAQFISCEERTESDSCGNCRSCLKFKKYIHPDVHFYIPTATSKEVPRKALSQKYYEQWRKFLSESSFISLSGWLKQIDSNQKEAIIPADESLQIIKDLSLKSFESPYRFAIIWLPEKLNVSASNKLLKIIEEPPDKVFFFLVSENTDKVLPTILSRTQILRIGKLTESELTGYLKQIKPSMSETEIHTAVKIADGNPLTAIRATENNLVDPNLTESFINWARMCYEMKKRMPELIEWSDQMSAKSREEQKSFLAYSLEFIRSSVMNRNGVDALFHGFGEENTHIENFSKLIGNESSYSLMNHLNEASVELERYANTRLLFLDLSVKFGQVINPKNVHL